MASEIFVNKITGTSGTSGGAPITLSGDTATLGSGVTNNAGVASGTIGDSTVMTNKYYLQLKCGSNHIESDGDAYIRTTDTTAPYFTKTGDTTNLLATDTTNIKVIRNGIYLVTFSVTIYKYSAQGSAQITAQIEGGTSVDPTSVIARADDNIASFNSSEPDYGNAAVTFIGELSANYFLRFHIKSVFDSTMTISEHTHASICLIRPL